MDEGNEGYVCLSEMFPDALNVVCSERDSPPFPRADLGGMRGGQLHPRFCRLLHVLIAIP